LLCYFRVYAIIGLPEHAFSPHAQQKTVLLFAEKRSLKEANKLFANLKQPIDKFIEPIKEEDTLPPEQPVPAVKIVEVPKEEPIEKLFSEEVEQAPVEEVLSSTDDTSRQPEDEPLLADNTAQPDDVLENANSKAKPEAEESAEDVEEKVLDSLQSILENLRLK